MSGAEAEIVRHHQVIERWLNGTAERSEFALLARAHAPTFSWIDPQGTMLIGDQVLAAMESVHGQVPGLLIEISDVRIVSTSGRLTVATFQEWQHGKGRLNTVVLRAEESAPGGLHWVHLHECWLP